jgi:hypothetical protein
MTTTDNSLQELFSYWDERETCECFHGIAILLGDEEYKGSGELRFDSCCPEKLPVILLDGENWQVARLRTHDKNQLELDLTNNDASKTVCISDSQIEKYEAFKLLLAVFDNTKHEKSEGEDYKDIEDFYGWELS